jgi:hypothetical protein
VPTAASFVVTTLSDAVSHTGVSLRDAITSANASPSGGAITFQAGLTGTITLAQGVLSLTQSMSITAPGTSSVAVDGNASSQVVNIGGGITVSMSSLTIQNGNDTSIVGGGGILNSGTLTLSSCSVINSQTGGNGGGIYNNTGATLTMNQCTISNNTANAASANGGGLFNAGTATITGSTFSGSGGGGIFSSGTLALSLCAVIGNSQTGSGNGGGINNQGALTVDQCTISNNTANAAFANGGGLFNSGSATITRSTFSGNTAIGGVSGAGMGGAINNQTSSSITLVGSTITGNSVTDPQNIGSGGGGAIYNLGVVAVQNSTIFGNAQTGTGADAGGGILQSSGTCTLTNTILAGNTDSGASPAPDGSGAFTDGGHNLIGNSTGMTGIYNGANGNMVGASGDAIDPLLSPLGNYGGPTQTMLPNGNSPVLAAGSTAGAPATDQRGLSRIVHGVIDIGAVQLQGVALTANAGTTPQ